MNRGVAVLIACLPATCIFIGLIAGLIRYKKHGSDIRKQVTKEFEEKRSKGGINSLFYKRPDKKVAFKTFGIPLFISLLVAIFMIMTMFTVFKTSNTKVSQRENQDVEHATGSFDHMSITYGDKYKITFFTQTTAHPSNGVDFGTDYYWKDDDGSGFVNINYVVCSDNVIENDYSDYDKLASIQIGDKIYKYMPDNTKSLLLYRVDDRFYLQVEIFGASQYNTEGDSVEVNKTPTVLIESGKLDDAIKFEIEQIN